MTSKAPRLTALAALVAAVFTPAVHAQVDDTVMRLVRPDSWIELGLGVTDKDAPRFGLYNGWNEKGGELLLDFDYRRRDDRTGTWYLARGRNLGLDNREVLAAINRQGNYGVSVGYSEITRNDPYRILTELDGIGTHDLRVSGTSPREVRLALERQVTTLGLEKYFGRNLSATVSFRNEKKDGERIFGRGTPSVMEFLAEPQHYTMQSVEATVAYADERLQLTGGFYGTAFDNDGTALDIAGGNAALASGAGAFTPIGLPPDNDSRQFYVAGGYNFTRATRVSFKFAQQRATQDDKFILAPASVVNRDNLGGRVDTTLAQLGLSSRLTRSLTLNANVRVEDRDDKTPLAQYFTAVTPTGTTTGFNEPRSIKTTFGKLEAAYDLGGAWRVAARYEYEEKDRNTSPVRVVTHRNETEENTVGIEVRRGMAETVTGSISYLRSDRGGSEYIQTTVVSGAPGSNVLAPLMLADRQRDRVRAMLDISVGEGGSVQLVAEESRDDYDQEAPRIWGPKEGRQRHFGIDGSFAIAEAWRLHAFAAVDQTRAVNETTSGALQWRARLRMHGSGLGVGVRGKIAKRYEAAVELTRFNNRSEFNQETIAGAAVPVVPDIEYRQTTLNANVRFPVGRDMAVRVQYIHDAWRTDEWTWRTFTYSDGTRVLQDQKQRVNFIGAAFVMTFR